MGTQVLIDYQSKLFTKLDGLEAENRRLETTRAEDIMHLGEDSKELFEQVEKRGL